MFGTHYDSHDVGPSVVDNATGMGATITVARMLRKHFGFRRGVRVIAFGAEEIGLQGSIVHGTRTAPELLTSCRLMANLDVVGTRHPGSVLSIEGSPGSRTVDDARTIAAAIGYASLEARTSEAPSGYMTSTDSTPYAFGQCPTATIGKWPFPYYHTQYDTLEEVDWEDLRQTSVIAGALVAQYAIPTAIP